MNFKMIRNILGWILLFEAGFMLVPAATAVVYGEWRELAHFGVAMLLCLAIGALSVWKKPENTALYAREGFVTVALSWMVMSFFGSIPFFTTGCIPNFVDALFEMTSGFTTTGSTILTSVEELPHCINMWRCFSHWIGGMGVLVFIMAFVSLSGGQNMHIMKAESPGPSVGKLVPRVRTTAMILYGIYLSMTFVMFIFLLVGDMNSFEALCTAFGTAGTGGFGVRNDSLASFSPYTQIVVTVFMLLFSINFSCYYLMLVRRFKDVFNVEMRWFWVIVAVSVGLITWNVYTTLDTFSSVGETVRHATFTVAALISTTGFATVDYVHWPTLSCAVIVVLTFIGACAGSTGGGFKISRFYILVKGAINELGNLAHPHRVKKVRMDGSLVDTDVVRTANIYLVWYVIVLVSTAFLLSFDPAITENALLTNFTASLTTLNNVGPGLGMIGPASNFSCYGVFSKLVLIVNMLIGRLELFPMLILCSPSTWKK